ncbi:MAG: hypothetical protein ACKOW8_08005, partial [Flavobacteriales bacterium]
LTSDMYPTAIRTATYMKPEFQKCSYILRPLEISCWELLWSIEHYKCTEKAIDDIKLSSSIHKISSP